jgi:hypothetical protein
MIIGYSTAMHIQMLFYANIPHSITKKNANVSIESTITESMNANVSIESTITESMKTCHKQGSEFPSSYHVVVVFNDLRKLFVLLILEELFN